MAALIDSGELSFTYQDFVLPIHTPQAQLAAEGAHCAADQGKFWAYHTHLLNNQKRWTAADLKRYARSLDLNTREFIQCLDSGKYRNAVIASTTQATDMGLTATPTFIVNGRVLEERSAKAVIDAIQDALTNR